MLHIFYLCTIFSLCFFFFLHGDILIHEHHSVAVGMLGTVCGDLSAKSSRLCMCPRSFMDSTVQSLYHLPLWEFTLSSRNDKITPQHNSENTLIIKQHESIVLLFCVMMNQLIITQRRGFKSYLAKHKNFQNCSLYFL